MTWLCYWYLRMGEIWADLASMYCIFAAFFDWEDHDDPSLVGGLEHLDYV